MTIKPDHLFAGTNHDNILDMIAKGRHYSKGKTLIEIFGEEDAARRITLLHQGARSAPYTLARRERMAQKMKEYWASLTDEERENRPKGTRDPVKIEANRLKMKEFYSIPENRAAHSERIKAWWAARKARE